MCKVILGRKQKRERKERDERMELLWCLVLESRPVSEKDLELGGV